MQNIKVISNQLHVDRWFYPKPNLIPDSKGNIAIVKKLSVGPCESFEWGITADKKFYEKYEWSEDDWFKDSSYEKIIEKEKMIEIINTIKSLIQNTNLCGWNEIYNKFLKDFCN